MKAKKRREVELALLVDLKSMDLKVVCGDCGVRQVADWKACVVRNVRSWVAKSIVQCECGSQLHTYCGDVVPMEMLREGLERKGLFSDFAGNPLLMSAVTAQMQ